MTTITAFTALLLAGTTASSTTADAADPDLGPLTAAYPAGGPAVVIRPLPEVPIVSLRLTVPVQTQAERLDAARVLQYLARPRMEKEVARYGAEVDLVRTPTHAVYQITGPARAFDAYAATLRRAVAAPDVTPSELDAIRVAVRAEATAELDTPEPLIQHRLRHALLPSPDPSATDAPRLTPRGLRAFWSTYYRPERMQAVVVGSVPVEAAVSAFAGWPEPSAPAESEAGRSAAGDSIPVPQVLFPWSGVGYRSDDIDPAVLAIASRLVERQLDRSTLRTSRAELWWAPNDHRALVLIGSGDRANGSAGGQGASAAAALSADLRQAIAGAAEAITAGSVTAERRALRRDIMLQARTPQGLARVLGEFFQRTSDPDSALRFLESLERVTAARVHDALDDLAARAPTLVEVTP